MGERSTPHPPRNGEGDRSAQPSGGGGPRRLNPRVLRTPIKQVKRARSLRKTLSLPEVLLWQQLRKRPGGLKFRKQFPIGRMTVDFACLERRLIIEVDGEGHNFGDQPRRDAARDASLRREGFRVMRVAARDVFKNMDGVLRFILASCSEVGPLHQPAAGPPPRSGEDLQ
jgi:very-short-patch-repair endonuclease